MYKVSDNAFTSHMALYLFVKVIPLAPWTTLWWPHWMIILETAYFFWRMTGWFSSSVKLDFLHLPSTHKMPLLSRNGSNWLTLLVFETTFFSDFSFLILWTNDSACTKRKSLSWTFWIISVSMLSFSWLKGETLAIMFYHTPFITMIRTIILFIFIKVQVISCSLDNTELF